MVMMDMMDKHITITDEQARFVEDNCINLSRFVQKHLDNLIKGEKR